MRRSVGDGRLSLTWRPSPGPMWYQIRCRCGRRKWHRAALSTASDGSRTGSSCSRASGRLGTRTTPRFGDGRLVAQMLARTGTPLPTPVCAASGSTCLSLLRWQSWRFPRRTPRAQALPPRRHLPRSFAGGADLLSFIAGGPGVRRSSLKDSSTIEHSPAKAYRKSCSLAADFRICHGERRADLTSDLQARRAGERCSDNRARLKFGIRFWRAASSLPGRTVYAVERRA